MVMANSCSYIQRIALKAMVENEKDWPSSLGGFFGEKVGVLGGGGLAGKVCSKVSHSDC